MTRSTEVEPTGPDSLLLHRIEALVGRLILDGYCDAKSIERGRRVAEDSDQRLDVVLIRLGVVTERGLASTYSNMLGVRLAGPERYPDAALMPERLSSRFLRQARAVPVAFEGNALVLAVADPLDEFTPVAVAAAAGRKVLLEVAVPIELEAALARLYPDAVGPDDGPETTREAEKGPHEEDAERLKDLASEAPVIRLVNQIISQAVESQASDIHIEPFRDRLRVRYRCDGELVEACEPSAQSTAAVTSRIKIMAHLDIAERRLPQDGRIKLAVRGTEVELRVSTMPSLYGEKVALRILDRDAVTFDFATLGLSAPVVERLNLALAQQFGLVLITGPTGSGKTTTLYTGLIALNSVSRNVVTVEDPIEHQIPGINQIQVRPQIGLSFATLLRHIVRQDPNVIMVGEIRDLETAQIAVQAALAGRLVLSTLHTNSAAATIARLRNMGLEDYLLTAVLRGVLAQRLVRRLCHHCREEADAEPELVCRFGLDRRGAATGGQVRLWHPIGCQHCRFTGYRGRLAIAEFLQPDAAIERLIFARVDHGEIERAATAAGMVTMLEAGLDAALAGITTITEVIRSIGSEV